MPSRKRTRTEMEASDLPPEKKEPSLLQRIRSMWEFAATMQYIHTFGKAVKIDEDFDIEDFEEECLKPGNSDKLEEIGLTLLKWISSHRGLTLDIWDEYTRRQYQAKAPERNPYGDEEEPKRFRTFDIFQRVRILHQLTVWTFWNPDRIRERMPEHQKESEQLDWRIEPIGWDEDEREYYVLDDSRLYRRIEPPIPDAPIWKPKKNTIKAQAARRRASKRRRIESEDTGSEAPEDRDISQIEPEQNEEKNGTVVDTFGGYKWECVAINLSDYQEFLNSIKKTRDPNQKELHRYISSQVMPIIEELADKQRRKQERRERELMLMEKMAGAKRSSRLADKQEREKKEQEEEEAARRKAADLAAAHREQERQQQMEEERQSRMMTREQRIKDREYKRLLMEEELARDAEEQKRIEEGEKRGSERHIRERIEKNKKELEELEAEEDWMFDCSGCGKHGKNYDDGSHSVACERCNIWQHSKCLGISKSAAEKDDFHLICNDCRKKEEEAKRPKIMLKFGPSSSPPQQYDSHEKMVPPAKVVSVDIPLQPQVPQPHRGLFMNGLQQTQSPIPRPTAPSPGSQLQRNVLDTQQQQSRQMPIHNSSSPPAQRFPSQHQTPNGNAVNIQQHQPSKYSHSTHQHQTHAGQSTFGPIQSTPRPLSGHGSPNGSSYLPQRLPSPVLNRPTMSPTQGNPEVGPIAGVPGSSPSAYHPALFTPNPNDLGSRSSSQEQQINGQQASQESASSRLSFTSQSPNPQHLSGLSPVKQRVTSPLPPPSHIPEKQNSMRMSPPSSAFNASLSSPNMSNNLRTVSGTPIFPPAEKLAPSPEQMNREPMPTPSKQPSPPMSSAEFRRSSGVADLTSNPHLNSNGNNTLQQPWQHQPTALSTPPPTQQVDGGHGQERRS